MMPYCNAISAHFAAAQAESGIQWNNQIQSQYNLVLDHHFTQTLSLNQKSVVYRELRFLWLDGGTVGKSAFLIACPILFHFDHKTFCFSKDTSSWSFNYDSEIKLTQLKK